MRRLRIVTVFLLVTGLLVTTTPPAQAGLNARKQESKDIEFSGFYPVCDPITVTRRAMYRLPHHARQVKWNVPSVGDQFGSQTHDPDHPWSVLGTISAEHHSYARRLFSQELSMLVVKNNPKSCDPGEPYNQGVYAGYEWLMIPSFTVSYGMAPRYRFAGFVGNFDGDRQHAIIQGDYHSLEFRDSLSLQTRYKVCVVGDSETHCWRRRTNRNGQSSVNASVFINDHTASGVVYWYVDGRVVARRSYALIAEGV